MTEFNGRTFLKTTAAAKTSNFEIIDTGDQQAVPADMVLDEFAENVPGTCPRGAREKAVFE